jgi:hypothetical protein
VVPSIVRNISMKALTLFQITKQEIPDEV